MAYVYILKSLNFEMSYVGSTVDLVRRLKEHNSGKSIFSRRYAPWKIAYSEEFHRLTDARKREKYFKSGAGRRRMKEILNIPRPASPKAGEVSPGKPGG